MCFAKVETLLLVVFAPRGTPRFPRVSEASLPMPAHAQTAPLTSHSSRGCGYIFYFHEEKATAPAASLQGAIDPARKSAPNTALSERTSCTHQQMLLAVRPAPTSDSLSPASAEVPRPPRSAAEGTGTAAAQGAGPALA